MYEYQTPTQHSSRCLYPKARKVYMRHVSCRFLGGGGEQQGDHVSPNMLLLQEGCQLLQPSTNNSCSYGCAPGSLYLCARMLGWCGAKLAQRQASIMPVPAMHILTHSLATCTAWAAPAQGQQRQPSHPPLSVLTLMVSAPFLCSSISFR
jgi:hypothetical protein